MRKRLPISNFGRYLQEGSNHSVPKEGRKLDQENNPSCPVRRAGCMCRGLCAILLGCGLFCAASGFNKLSIKNNPAVLVPKLWAHVIFAAVLLGYLIPSAVLLLLLGNGKQQPTFLSDMEGALLSICAAAVLYKLSFKNNFATLALRFG
jgi:hypothetical protein